MAVSSIARAQLVAVAFSQLLAGGISIGLGGFLSARTARKVLQNRIATERREIRDEPEEERAELRAIYRDKGLRGSLLNRVVRQLTADEGRWLRAMVRDELGVIEEQQQRP
jgi:VIT1/CCC1 family predicted Fe2+/Mn2+ transporter